MSVDGFVTAPNDGPGRGLGDDGEFLHYWVFGGPWEYGTPHDFVSTGVDKEVLDEAMPPGAPSSSGVVCMTSPTVGAAARPSGPASS
jgi:hypothetical protein